MSHNFSYTTRNGVFYPRPNVFIPTGVYSPGGSDVRIQFYGNVRKTTSGSYFVVIPKERIHNYYKEVGIGDFELVGHEVKVEVEL